MWLDRTPRIPVKVGVQLLVDSDRTGESYNPALPHTRDEIRLGELIEEKYHTDYYILDKSPQDLSAPCPTPMTQVYEVIRSFPAHSRTFDPRSAMMHRCWRSRSRRRG